MSRRPLAVLYPMAPLAIWVAISFAAEPRTSSPPESLTARPRPIIYGTVPDTGQFLADSAALAQVNDKVIRVRDFVESYFTSYAEFRPPPDSAGRVQFLNNMINKEILAHVARRAGRAEAFEDRVKLRDHSQRVLANVLFQRAVLDSLVEPSEEEIDHAYRQAGYELRLQRIAFAERPTAERVRHDLVARRLDWRSAVQRHSRQPEPSQPDGDLGWQRRDALPPTLALQVFDLEVGQISPVLVDSDGYAIYRAAERRQVPLPPYRTMRGFIRDHMRQLQAAERTEPVLSALRMKVGMTYDSANVAWAAAQFKPPATIEEDALPTLDINVGVPHFEPEDKSRVLARWNGGELPLGAFAAAYEALNPVGRRSVATAEALQRQIDVFALEPNLADLARDRGLLDDSLAIAMIEEKREEILVEHLYQDSILSKVWVPKAERRKYYREHIAGFITFPTVRYAHFHLDTRAEAESLAMRLRAGEKAETLLQDRSHHGIRSGEIEERRHTERGTPFYDLLFEDLRPGQVAVEGPDGSGHYDVLQSLAFDPGRQLSYEEAAPYIDESLQNLTAEKMLEAFLTRHRRKMKITGRPEMVMRVRLSQAATL